MKGNEDDDPGRLRNYSCFKRFDEREMDVIEMAVYGSVKREGLRCRCWSVGEMLRQFNDQWMMAGFKLPNCT